MTSGWRRKVRGAIGAAVVCGLLGAAPVADASSTSVFSPISGTPGAIPDGTAVTPPAFGPPLDVKFNVIGLPRVTLSDVQLLMSFSPAHTFAGDVVVDLIAPDSTSRTIFGRTGATSAASFGDNSDLSGEYFFGDSANTFVMSPSGGWWQAAAAANSSTAIAAGSYRTTDSGGAGAVTPMPPTTITPSYAANTNLNGTWTLRFRDASATETGTVATATLILVSISAPTLSTVTPAGPANDNNPVIKGTAEGSSTVRFYTTPDCSGAPFGSGPASALNGSGITVPVPDDSTTALRATATDGSGHISPCSDPITYVEDSTGPAPTLTGTTPGSPANTHNPVVHGTIEAGATVRLFSTADCGGAPVGTGTADDLGGAGIAVAVSDNTTTEIRATGTDAVGNVSACSSPVAYSEDSAPPETAITKAPAKRTRKAKTTIEFGATDPTASFECSLNGAAFAACASPAKVKAKKGRNRFAVRGTDAAGNIDAEPAVASWKLKKKKRRHHH